MHLRAARPRQLHDSPHYRELSPCSNQSEQLLFGIDGNKYKAPQLDKEEREGDISALRLNWDVFIKSLPSRLRALCGRGIGKALIVQVMEHSKEVVSSRQKRTDEHINSWRLRQHAQGLIFPFVSHAGFLSK